MNPNNVNDPYQQILFGGYTDQEITEIQTLMAKWDDNKIISYGEN